MMFRDANDEVVQLLLLLLFLLLPTPEDISLVVAVVDNNMDVVMNVD